MLDDTLYEELRAEILSLCKASGTHLSPAQLFAQSEIANNAGQVATACSRMRRAGDLPIPGLGKTPASTATKTRKNNGGRRDSGIRESVRNAITEPMTAREITKKTGLTDKQVSNNLWHLKNQGIVISERVDGEYRWRRLDNQQAVREQKPDRTTESDPTTQLLIDAANALQHCASTLAEFARRLQHHHERNRQ